MRKLILLLVLGFNAVTGYGQNQQRMGQYMTYQPLINPATLASYDCFTAALHYRKQWTGIEGAPTYQGAAFNLPLFTGYGYLGGSILHDVIGVNRTTTLATSYAYKFKLNQRSHLALGLQAQAQFYQSNFGELALAQAGDPLLVADPTPMLVPDFQFGAYYFRDDAYAGFAIQNLLSSGLVIDDPVRAQTTFEHYNWHYLFHAGKRFELQPGLSLNTSTLVKVVAGAPLQVDLNAQVLLKERLGLGLSVRSSKEVLPIISWSLTSRLLLSYAYEYNWGTVGEHSLGSHEIILLYQRCKSKKTTFEPPRF